MKQFTGNIQVEVFARPGTDAFEEKDGIMKLFVDYGASQNMNGFDLPARERIKLA